MLDILLSKCGLKGRKANDVIFGGYAGMHMAWVRRSDKVNSERLKTMVCALQAKTPPLGWSCVAQHMGSNNTPALEPVCCESLQP